jgi:hypothetical protein
MSGYGLHIDVDISDADRELARLEHGPSLQNALEFEAAVQGQLARTRADVHIWTGSLYLSGRADTDFHNGMFEGTITFGGYAPGGKVSNVDYAAIELARGGPGHFVADEHDHRGRDREVPANGPLTDRTALPEHSRTPRASSHNFFKAVEEGFGEHAYIAAILDYLRG